MDGGLYLIKEGKAVDEPGQMLLIKNDPKFNEQWPRALVPYTRVHGIDQPKSLGTSETGGQAALPIWIAYMQRALKGVPEQPMEPPDGIVSLRINAESGLRDDNGALSEWFFSEYVPRREESTIAAPGAPNGPPRDVRNQLF